jgi:hypothetical protein
MLEWHTGTTWAKTAARQEWQDDYHNQGYHRYYEGAKYKINSRERGINRSIVKVTHPL